MPWPAWLRTTEPAEGTCYISGSDFPTVLTRHNRSGSAWKYKQKWSTYCPNRRISYKAIDRLQPESPDDFWSIMEAAKAADINPPTSYADLFLSTYRSPMPRITVRSPFVGFRFGGWNEAFRRGEIRGRVYQYDLNSAYRWAASLGLPDLRTAYATRDFSVPYGVFLVTNLPVGSIPWNRASRNTVFMVTSEERNALDLPADTPIIKGIAFRDTVKLDDAFTKVDTLFKGPIAKRISRAFWGIWNTQTAPEVYSWKHGEKVRRMRNPWYNPIWSAFITSRVKLRIAVYRGRAIHCATDSVHLAGQEIETGCGLGDWKLAGTYDRFWCRAPNQWGDGEYTIKWSGAGSILMRPGNKLIS